MGANVPTAGLGAPANVAYSMHLFRHSASVKKKWLHNTAIRKPDIGLFGHPGLTSPKAFEQFAADAYKKASTMSAAIETGQVPINECITRLDVLSDTICKVVDMAAFIGLSHPDPLMVRAAQNAHNLLFNLMNQFNTNQSLYRSVSLALEQPEVRSQLSTSEVSVATILKHDFEKSGIHLPSEARREFVKSSNVLSLVGQEFLNKIGPATPFVTFSSVDDLNGLDSSILLQLPRTFTGKIQFPLTSGITELALQTVKNRESRKKIWLTQRTAAKSQKTRLREILTRRHQIAKISGYPSFGHYELSDKMMHTPERVDSFLKSILSITRPKTLAELVRISGSSNIKPWDHSYFAACYNSNKRARFVGAADSIMNYFNLENVMEGYSLLCELLFGIKLRRGVVAGGEVWHPDVKRFDVFENDRKIGMIYCDFFQRENKSPNAAHFTIQCARQVWPWELDLYDAPSLSVVERNGVKEHHQLPIIALMCDFNVRNGQCYLTLQELQTLFHEMGHAIHSMIGRTDLHNVSGTRCATDFVELPSILMEKFATAPDVLALFARHEVTKKSLPKELLWYHLSFGSTSEYWEIHYQILLSLMDQALHGEVAGECDFDPSEVAKSVRSRYSIFPYVHSENYAQFGHIVSYGATYYSYLLDRCLASMAWKKLFEKDPLSADSGRRLKNSVLQWGGVRDAATCVEELLETQLDYAAIAKHIEL